MTRAYFAGEALNETDPILSLIEDAARRATLLARPAGAATWHIDIRLQGEGETVFLEVLSRHAGEPCRQRDLGTLYGSDAMRAVFDDHAGLRRMLAVEAALARVEARLGLIPADAAAAITAAAERVHLDDAALAASVRMVGYPVVGLVAALSREAGEAGRWTHWGATTQDIIDTALALQLRDALDLLRDAIAGGVRALATLAELHRATVMPGRTHLQHALPITFGLKCAVWLMPLLNHLARLDQLRPRVEIVQFGGAAGTLASLGDQGIDVMEALAAELGLRAPPAPWHVARDGVAEAVSFCGLLCGSLAKIATDVVLLAQTEVAEAAEPHADGRGGSSTMPQKRNPIASEYIIAAARAVQALVPLMQGAMAGDQERATGPWQAEALALPQAFLLSHGAAVATRALAEGLVVDAARMRAQPGCDRRADRRRGGDDGPGAASRPRRGAPCRPPRQRRRAGRRHQACRGAVARAKSDGKARCRGDRAADRPDELPRQRQRLHRPRAARGAAGGVREKNMADPCIITVAITGSVPRKRDNPAVPITIAEQVESTHEAFEAGASLVHVHVRDENENPILRPGAVRAAAGGRRASTAPA